MSIIIGIKERAITFSASVLSWLTMHKDNSICMGLYNLTSNVFDRISNGSVYSVVSSQTYSSIHSSKCVRLSSERTGYAANAVLYGSDETQITKKLPLSPIILHEFDDVHIHHCSDHVINMKEKVVINDFCANNKDENGRYVDLITKIHTPSVVILKKMEQGRAIESGIMMSGKFSFNYYHNVYENLIRLLLLEEHNALIPSDVSVIVDEDVYRIPSLKRLYEILSSFIKRETIVIKKDELMKVGHLYWFTPINDLVSHHKEYIKGRMEDYVFDKEYILKLRNKLLNYKESSEQPKRFFITRRNTTHRNFNEDELFDVLEPYGFQRVAPETLSFEQQITLFNNAEWIVGGSGAAFTNLMFCSGKCNIVCIYRNSSYIPPVFTAPVCFVGANMCYFQSSLGVSEQKAHTSFSINKEQLKQFVNDYIAPQM